MDKEKSNGKRLRKHTTRRQFLKVAGIGGLSAASLYLLGCAAEAVTTTKTVTTTVTGPGVTTTVTAPGTTATVTTGPGTTVTTTAPGVTTTVTAVAEEAEITWDYEADVVVIGSGAMGMPAAIRARDRGASVIVVEANWDIGGQAILSGGSTSLGGGTSNQAAGGIVDSPDLIFKDITDWSVVSHAGVAAYRHVDREQCRAYADNSAACFEFLLANGVVYPDTPTVSHMGAGLSVPRTQVPFHPRGGENGDYIFRGNGGGRLIRPLEESARAKGVQFMLNRHMDEIFRESPTSGRVLGVSASYSPVFRPDTGARMESYYSAGGAGAGTYDGNIEETRPNVNIKAKQAVILATGSFWGNKNLCRGVMPQIGEENLPHGIGYSPRIADGSGHIAAYNIGATPWGHWIGLEHGWTWLGGLMGHRDGFSYNATTSAIFPLAGATGVGLGDWQNGITVNQAGKRFYNEMFQLQSLPPTYGLLTDPVEERYLPENYVQGDWRNTLIEYAPRDWPAAARQINELSEPPDYNAGPTWAIVDAAAFERSSLAIGYPATLENYAFQADTLSALAALFINNPYQKRPMPATNLEATVARYNSFVDTGVDLDFDKDTPQFKIETPPFYAFWFTPILLDCYSGIHVNGKWQVVDRLGNIIPSLYAGGELVGGAPMHGLQTGLCPGYIAGWHAAGLASV